MKKWLLMFSVIALSNLVCAMECREHGDDWEQVDDNATQLVEDLINIKKNDEWEELDPMGTQIHGILTFSDDYPDVTPTMLKVNPDPVPSAVMETLPVSNSIAEAYALSSNKQSQTSSNKQVHALSSKLRVSSMIPDSPIAVSTTVAASLHHMTSSLHASEISADDNHGLSYCHDDDFRNDDYQQQQKRQYLKNKIQDDSEKLTFTEFLSFIFSNENEEDSSQ